MFEQSQIQEFKEAFSMLERGDGFIDAGDLKDMLLSLGQSPTDEYVEDMVSEAPGSINFTMFLTLFADKMTGTDPEAEILTAFEAFDPHKSGNISADTLREAMTTMGDRFTDDEVRGAYVGGCHVQRDSCRQLEPIQLPQLCKGHQTWRIKLNYLGMEFSV